MKSRAIYPGTFDPVTNGHVDIIGRAARIFPELIVAVASNQIKRPFFPLETRIMLLQESVKDFSNVKVIGFDNLLIDLVQQQQAQVIIRGLRAVSDFEYEFQLALMNKKIAPDIETIFLMTQSEYSFISSSAIKWAASLHAGVLDFVPQHVQKALNMKYASLRSDSNEKD